MAKIEDEDEAFAEEECTMDFADEPEEVKHQTTATAAKFHIPEYPGEDFSQYLEDDDDFHARAYLGPVPHPPGTQDGGSRSKSTYEAGYSEELPWELALAATAIPVEPERNRSTDVIKDRVSKWLNTVKRIKSPSGKYDNQQGYGTTARLSDFSYNDSKICSTGPGSDSGIDMHSVRASSDTGYGEHATKTAKTGKWEEEGQSTVRRVSGIEAKAARMRKSKSSSNLSGYSGSSLTPSSDGNVSPSGGGGSLAGKTLTNAWKKISTSLSRKPKFSNNASGEMHEGHYSGSTLSYNSDNIYEDIRL